jgi:hypothetical protein
MKRSIKYKLPELELGNVPIEFEARDSKNKKLGTLKILKAQVRWMPADKSVNEFKFSWKQLADILGKEPGKPVRASPRNSKKKVKPGEAA